MKKKNKDARTRREFLIDSGKATAFLGALDTIFGSLLSSSMSKAYGAIPAGGFANFLHVNMYASPPRWMFDLMLNPKNIANEFLANGLIKNIYTDPSSTGRYNHSNAAYRVVESPYKMRTTDAQGIFVPHLLSRQVPRAGGGTRPAWNLLQNMISIRGIDVLNAGHPGANQLHQAAVVGSPTISSVSGDNASLSSTDPTKNVMRAISLSPSPGSIYKSAQGYSGIRYDVSSTGNQLTKLFASLQPLSSVITNTQFLTNKDALEYQIEDALKALQPRAVRYYTGLMNDSSGAFKILTDDTVTTFSALATDWSALFDKYNGLLQTVMTSSFAGINDKRIGTATPASLTAAERLYYGYSPLRDVAINQDAGGVVDLRLILADATATRLAGQFAVTEFLMTRGVCPSVSLVPAALENLAIQSGTGARRMTGMILDQHYTGFMPGILTNSIFYLGLTACLLELFDALKAKTTSAGTVYDNTLVYMASEFNRAARVDGSGSDHAAPAAHVNLISGRIPSYKLIGNIYKDSAGKTASGADLAFPVSYKGSWGHGAPFVGGVPLNIVQVWGSVMQLLGAAELPNAVDKTKLLFNTAGNPTLTAMYDKPAVNVVNASKS